MRAAEIVRELTVGTTVPEVGTKTLLSLDAEGVLPGALTALADALASGSQSSVDDAGHIALTLHRDGELVDEWQWRWPSEGGAYLTPATRRRAQCLRVAADALAASRRLPDGRVALRHGHPVGRVHILRYA